ncbi:MAG TPA: hypothetical protein VHV78_17065, partial [Gemmatimonadaceae bacterium]|nr:hypothetical protein [Gemmatimonadaceae bacterium]
GTLGAENHVNRWLGIRRADVVAGGFLAGLVLGAFVWSAQIHRSRRELFSRSAAKRLAALGFLHGRPGLDSVRILTEYVRWERHPALRSRGERLLRSMQSQLD